MILIILLLLIIEWTKDYRRQCYHPNKKNLPSEFYISIRLPRKTIILFRNNPSRWMVAISPIHGQFNYGMNCLLPAAMDAWWNYICCTLTFQQTVLPHAARNIRLTIYIWDGNTQNEMKIYQDGWKFWFQYAIVPARWRMVTEGKWLMVNLESLWADLPGSRGGILPFHRILCSK